MSNRILFLLIGFLCVTASGVGQVRERESSYSHERLRRIRDGRANSDLKFDVDLHQFQRDKGFSEGLAYVVVNGKWGFIDQTGAVIIKPQFDDVGCFKNGMAPVEKNGKWGYVDRTGNVVIDFTWDWACDFYEGRALVMLNKRWGYIDANGNAVIKPQFGRAHSFSDGLALVRVDDGKKDWGYIDANGRWIIKLSINPVYHPLGDFKDGLAHVHVLLGQHPKGGVMVEDGYIDKTGKVVLKPIIDGQASEFYEGLAQFRVTSYALEKYGFFNRDGSIAIEPKFDYAGHFSEGLVPVAIENKWGFADKQGTLVIKPQFQLTHDFAEGLAPVVINRKWGYIDKSGSIVIEPKFDLAWGYSEGFALVAVGQSVGYINKFGEYIWTPSK